MKETPVEPSKKKPFVFPIPFSVESIGCLVFLIMGCAAAFYIGALNPLTNPEHLRIAPTAVIVEITPPVSVVPWWDEVIDGWYSSFDSAQLREEENAVNFVILDPNEIKFAQNQTFALGATWSQERPYFLEAVSVDGTAVIAQMGSRQYHINAFQPFTWKTAPNLIVMIDLKGQPWVIESDFIQPVAISDVDLPVNILPNPELEIGSVKQ